MSSRTKWSCSVCTYENWPAAIKCTLCRSARATPYVDETAQIQDRNAPAESGASLPSDSGRVLRCPSCTFVNKSSSFKCEHCFHVLQDPPEAESSLSKMASASANSSSLPVSAETGKWSCPQCTYENWPKSRLCVMCHSPPSSSNLDYGHHPVEDATRKGSTCTGSTLSPNPTGVPLSKSGSLEHMWLGACRAVLENEVAPIERYLLGGGPIERKLTKKDCNHLSKVLRSNRGESQSVLTKMDGMVSSSEDSADPECAEASASEDASHIGDNGKFRVGWTLIDLAIRFGRTDLINLFVALNGLQNTNASLSVGSSLRTTGMRFTVAAQPEAVPPRPGKSSNRKQPNRCLSSAPQQLSSRVPSLTRAGVSRSKWMPCQASPLIAKELRTSLSAGVKNASGEFPCAFLNEWGTFALPQSIGKLPPPVKYLLLSEVCDTQAQTELEDDARAINWWFIPGQKQDNRLFALWNRTAGDCLLDSVLQACWGLFDRENFLRHTLAQSLRICESSFYTRWRDYEALQAACHYILDETQCRRDWDNVLTAASRPGGALEQIHIFALSHILRRPIIVYGVKYIKNYLDEPIGIANFQGIYLPLLWERTFCSKNPIVLGYTRGHFTALVPMEPSHSGTAVSEHQMSPVSRTPSSSSSRKHSPTPSEDAPVTGTNNILQPDTNFLHLTETLLTSGTSQSPAHPSFVYLPLVDRQGATLPIHFTTEKEANISHVLLRDWLDVVSSRRGLPLARLRLQTRHILVERMLDEWLSSYRTLAKLSLSSTCATQNQENENRSSSSSSSDSTSSSSSVSVASECERRLDSNELEDQRSQSS